MSRNPVEMAGSNRFLESHQSMKKPEFEYQPNLAIREFNIPAGEEWRPRLTGWSLIQVRQGSGYCLRPRVNLELEPGTVVLLAGYLPGSIRASQLGGLSFSSFSVIPERLASLITLSEQRFLKLPPANEFFLKTMPPDSLVATKMRELLADNYRNGLVFRLKLLQIFAEFFLHEQMQAEFTEFETDATDAMRRLQELVQQMPSSELLELDFNELAVMTHCTTRHLSRIFYKLVGMSFTDKRAELRLARAEELLATTDSKVVQVALDCGYNSLSQFNLMFVRRYGISPGKWRQKNGLENLAKQVKKNGQRSGSLVKNGTDFRRNPSLKFAADRSANGRLKAKQG